MTAKLFLIHKISIKMDKTDKYKNEISIIYIYIFAMQQDLVITLAGCLTISKTPIPAKSHFKIWSQSSKFFLRN